MNPYEAVYGQKMDHMVMCTKDEARGCWTLPQILKVSDDPEFKAYAEDNYLLADEEDNNDGDDDDDADGYFSDGPVPHNEMEEVDDEFFFENILEENSVNYGKSRGIVPGDESRSVDSNVVGGDDLHYTDDEISGGELLEAIGFCPPVNTPLCDWAHYGLCPTDLEPEPCQKEGANCDRSAHCLCVSGWEARYDMGRQQGIATLCMTHHPTAGLRYVIPQKVAAQAKDVAQKLMFDAQVKVAAHSKDVAEKLIFHAQENEFSTRVK